MGPPRQEAPPAGANVYYWMVCDVMGRDDTLAFGAFAFGDDE